MIAAPTYLTTSFKDREAVKALGARWDPEAKKWYVPPGRDLTPFSPWLPAQTARLPAVGAGGDAGELALPDQGMSLSQLLGGVAQLIAQAYRSGVWTRVEVVKAEVRRGHVYLELAERSLEGDALAQARGVIWANIAHTILPDFQRATGAELAAGLKLLVRAKPEAHPLYGLSLLIDAIDPQYTLGDLEAKKREIRSRLQREGLYEANRRLPQPWDYQAVLVIAPPGAAGLGDFRAEAERLQKQGICRFVYAFSRFQGEGAAAEIRAALMGALQRWREDMTSLPDAVVIIRGGGAVNDLAWLNDYELTRSICQLDVPVLTGIGHERDSTLLDEVANLSFDTPSKLILGIEQVIRKRAFDARSCFEAVVKTVLQAIHRDRQAIERAEAAVRAGAVGQLASARRQADARLADVRLGALQSIHAASAKAQGVFFEVRHEARQQISTVRQTAASRLSAALELSQRDVRIARQDADRAMSDLTAGARQAIGEAASRSEALMREIAGQGPDKALGRGFALVRTLDGRTVTGAAQAQPGEEIEIQFRDGRVPARTTDKESKR